MINGESTYTNTSTFKNITNTKQQLNVLEAEKWEIDIIGNLVLHLYHRAIITPKQDWCVQKSEIRKEYARLVTTELRQRLKKQNDVNDIGTLLRRCGFLFNTPRGSTFYKIRCKKLFDFRNKKLKELDNAKVNNDIVQQNTSNEGPNKMFLNLFDNHFHVLEEDNIEIDENEHRKPLEYQGTTIQRRAENYYPTNTSCYICQEDFSTIETYEEHIQTHGDETDFAFLTSMDKCETQYFTMNYRLCKNSHNFCFEFETSFQNLVIEKIIIVQSRSFVYVHNMRMPYKFPDNGMDRFFVDSHLFTRHVEQPIVLICHMEDNKDSLIIEQHHFMRSEEFPKVYFPVNPYRLPDKKLFKSKFKLPDYFPTREIKTALKDDFYHENLMKTSNEFRNYVRNGKNLQLETVGASLNILLQIEDIDTIHQYFELKGKDVILRSYGDEYSFKLKPKKRISLDSILSVNDEVILTTRTDIYMNNEEMLHLMLQNKSDIWRMKNSFVGLIQDINTGRISFKCEKKLDIHKSYTVICRPSRLNLRYQYRSLELLSTNMTFLRSFLFPTKLIPMPLSNVSLNLYNTNLNEEQLQAVRNIAEGPRNDATYIIFGPPGTGKTTTVVESILQVLKKPGTKILVTASSNSACDEIALRLCKYLKKLDITRAMVRIYSRSAEIRTETIDDELLENSNMYNGQFYPDIEILHEYRVVVCTLSVVGKLSTGNFGRSQNGGTVYTHLFIDEVAASMETEALLAITTVLTPKSCLIISGDHKQLGPVLQSKRAKELGLGASLMDRLLERECYRVDIETGHYDRTIQTRLVKNYRSHPAIVNLYSGLYYNHSLEALANPDDFSACEVWHRSRNNQYPILFHAVYEPSKYDNQSTSLYNLKELYVLMGYVKDFMYFGINGEPVKESDIGIISPYKKQYQRIQEQLKLRKWFGIETGSVETYQGKEKKIIIVSFVRSGTENLGFLDDPRRLNVTLSRPKSLLILIGNPDTLSLNSDFEYIIKECQRNNTFVGINNFSNGINCTKSQENVSQLNEKLQSLNVEISQKTHQYIDEDNDKAHKKVAQVSQSRYGRNKGRKINKNIHKGQNKKDNVEHRSEEKDTRTEESQSKQSFNAKQITLDIRKGDEIRESVKGREISEENGKGNEKCTTNNKSNKLGTNKIDFVFDELPQVPKTFIKPTTIAYTKNELLQMQQNLQMCRDNNPSATARLPSNLSCIKKVNSSDVRDKCHLTESKEIITNTLKASEPEKTSYANKQPLHPDYKEAPSTDSGNSINATTTNSRNSKPKANIYPVLRNSSNIFSTDAIVNNDLNSSSSSSNVIRTSSSVVLPGSSVHANIYRNSNASSNSNIRSPTRSIYNNTLSSLNNTNTFTGTNIASDAFAYTNWRPIRDLEFQDKKKSQGKKCVIS